MIILDQPISSLNLEQCMTTSLDIKLNLRTYCILCLVIDNEAIALTVSFSSHKVASTALHDTVCASFFNTGQWGSY